jgi:hypothetical protein
MAPNSIDEPEKYVFWYFENVQADCENCHLYKAEHLYHWCEWGRKDEEDSECSALDRSQKALLDDDEPIEIVCVYA